jgi:Tol biopolymer transport system component/DNA-binding winged helix-turn-helix (wHTH) protein
VESSGIGDKVRFGPFEADLRTGELRKLGIRIKLQGQPFKVLALLIERAGDVVSREELQREIWGPTTVVDFDRGIGTAINKVREALCDSAENPRYLETLARRGYRFIAEVHPIAAAPPASSIIEVMHPAPAPPQTALLSIDGEKPAAAEAVATAAAAETSAANWRRVRPYMLAARAVSVLALAVLIFRWSGWKITAQSPVGFQQITWSEHVYPGDNALERFPAVATDGLNVFFPEMRDRNLLLSTASIRDDDTHPVPVPSEVVRPSVTDISPDGTRLLVLSMTWVEPEHPLWVVPTRGGAARKVPNASAHDATWTPDGEGILFASGHNLILTGGDGTQTRKLATLPGRPFWIRYSPHGSAIRLTLRDPKTGVNSLWELSADGTGLHPLATRPRGTQNECCGSWTPDGDYVFQVRAGHQSNIWMRRETRLPLPDSERLIQLTRGPLNYMSPVAERHGHRLFVIGTHERTQLLHFDPATKQFASMPEITNRAAKVEFSRDGSRVAWISSNDGTLWQSMRDGSQRLQLTSGTMRVVHMRWSPDGQRLAFVGNRPGDSSRIYLVAADGAHPEVLLREAGRQSDPSWSADGNSIVFGRSPQYIAEDTLPKELYVINLKTRVKTVLPGSKGLFSPRWSPDGRFIAALSLDQRRLQLFDRTNNSWRNLATQSINNPWWSNRGDAIYFQSPAQEDQPIYRVELPAGRVERVVDFRTLRQADKVDYLGLAPDDGPMLSLRYVTADIYSLTY